MHEQGHPCRARRPSACRRISRASSTCVALYIVPSECRPGSRSKLTCAHALVPWPPTNSEQLAHAVGPVKLARAASVPPAPAGGGSWFAGRPLRACRHVEGRAIGAVGQRRTRPWSVQHHVGDPWAHSSFSRAASYRAAAAGLCRRLAGQAPAVVRHRVQPWELPRVRGPLRSLSPSGPGALGSPGCRCARGWGTPAAVPRRPSALAAAGLSFTPLPGP